MANVCEFSIKVVGKEEDCVKFCREISDPTSKHFLKRCEIASEDGSCTETEYTLVIDGTCAWSLANCNAEEIFSQLTEELQLKLEAFSNEYGVGIEEHYLYDNGECIYNECVSVKTYYWDRDAYPTYEHYLKAVPDAPDESCFEYTDEVHVGGFDEDYCNWEI